MKLAKVHITFTPEVARSPEARAAVVAEIERVAGLTEINQKRLQRYGLLSGVVEESRVAAIRSVNGVRAVELDRIRQTSDPS